MKPGAAVLVGLSAWLLLFTIGCRDIPTPRPGAALDRDAAWIQDLTYLREKFPRYNKSFDAGSLAAFRAILAETLASVPALTDNEITVRIMRALATAQDRHTGVNLAPSAGKLRRLPLRFYWFAEGLYVIRAAAEHADLLGAKVAAIGGLRPEELLDRMRDLVSGSDSAARYDSAYYLSSPDFLQGLGVVEDAEAVTVRLETAGGGTLSRELRSMPLGAGIRGYDSWRELSPLSTVGVDAPDFVHVLRSGSLPPYLTEPNRAAFARVIAGGSVLYLQINENANLGVRMSDVARQAREALESGSFTSVIVDLRFNTGGNLLATGELVKGLPKWHSGRIYIVVGGPTFSAGIVTAARLKYYGAGRVVVVGEPASEGLRFWAETRFFTLPNSRLRLSAAYRYHNWESRDYDRGKPHFWLMRLVGVPAGDLSVDMPVEATFADYLAGRDTVVEAILRHAQAP